MLGAQKDNFHMFGNKRKYWNKVAQDMWIGHSDQEDEYILNKTINKATWQTWKYKQTHAW
jgi:hypothetical protein